MSVNQSTPAEIQAFDRLSPAQQRALRRGVWIRPVDQSLLLDLADRKESLRLQSAHDQSTPKETTP